MTKICAFDVGIKNLAYCCITKTTDVFTIDHWGNIDLTIADNLICTKCKKAAKFCTNNSTIEYYCGTHKNNIIINQLEWADIDNGVCNICGKAGKYINNEAIYCKLHKEAYNKRYLKESTAVPIKKKKCTSTDPQILCKRMYEVLTKLSDIFIDINEVYIENQPSLKNPTMKTVSTMLFSYFVYHYKDTETIVKFVSPGGKILLSDGLIEKVNKKTKEHNTKDGKCKCRLCKLSNEIKENKDKAISVIKYKFSYDATKELGIIYTEKILEENKLGDKWDLVKELNKKDDVCDAFLHGYKRL